MKKFLITLAGLSLMCGAADAQSFLERVTERAKNAAEQNIGEKVEKGVNDVLNGNIKKKGKAEMTGEAGEAVTATWTCPECGKAGNDGKFCEECGAKKADAETTAKPRKQVETSYAKTDFVPGDEIFFEDSFENEQLGEFPLRWDLLDGYVETMFLEGRKVLAFTDNGLGQVMPLIKDDQWNWLPEIFTLEFDLFVAPVSEDGGSELRMGVRFGNRGASDYYNAPSYVLFSYREDGSSSMEWSLSKPSANAQVVGAKELGLNPDRAGYNETDNPLKPGEWNHFAFSFNKRAFKGYVNGFRIINVPSMEAPGYLYFDSGAQYAYSGISHVRIAQGAVPLYDRLMSEGKIVTYAITFETGKADLKPESMVEILRVAGLMKDNPGLEFEVQGHCDATGSDKVNDPLSQKRAEAIVAALVEQGIASARLIPVGKGSHQPIASNSTEEGRAKNRRVEFVKK